jgi:hypothetical protein
MSDATGRLPSGEPARVAAAAVVEGEEGADTDAPEMTSRGAAIAVRKRAKISMMDRLEAGIARLSARNNFWHRVCSMIWLPFAYRSGIRMKKTGDNTFVAELPFRRFNRNWYNAMAGAALLGNSEIAGGMYVFNLCGGDYTIVCKQLQYRFLRPCFGPAIYRITPKQDVKALIAAGGEFNIDVDMDVVQLATLPMRKEKRVGRASATFHVTPQAHQKAKRGHVRNVGNAG